MVILVPTSSDPVRFITNNAASQVWVVSLPLIILNSPAVSAGQPPSFGTASDILGIIIWILGWFIESIADVQKYRYKSSHPPKDKPIDVGSSVRSPLYTNRS